jgi:hypothetical protein
VKRGENVINVRGDHLKKNNRKVKEQKKSEI